MDPAVSHSRAIAPVAFADGLGERLYAVGAANEPLEVLKISNELSCVSTFEDALREQAARLADFRHEAFARVRAVERLDSRNSSIVVISDHVRGVRLSELLAGSRKRSIPLEYAAAAWLIRQLVSAMAAFHDSGPWVCHGAIAPERLVVTPDGRLVVAEYVLGPALEEMHFSWERFWRELGIALPRPIGLPHFDQTADVTQVAAVALALLMSRPLAADEYPHRITDVLDSVTARGPNGVDPLPDQLRTWLRRALHIEPRAAFTSAIEAQAELDRVLDVSDAAGRLALRSFLSRYAAAMALERQLASHPKPAARHAEAPRPHLSPLAPAVPAVPPPVVEPAVVEPAAHEPVGTTAFAAPAAEPAASADLVAEPLAAAPLTPGDAFLEAPLPAGEEAAVVEDHKDADEEEDPGATSQVPASVTPLPTPASWTPPEAPVPGASATPFTPRVEAPEWRVPAPVTGPWANVSADIDRAAEPVMSAHGQPELDAPEAAPEVTPPPAAEPRALVKARRPAWQSPWAVAAVLALIAVTTGVTILGRRAAPAAAPASNTGTLEIGTNPDGVAVFIDGSSRGTTPLTVTLSPGAHVVELVTETDRRKVPVTLKAGTHMSHFIEMPRTPSGTGELLVRTEPSKAKVTVDGRLYGRSPVTVKGLAAGTHRVELESEFGTFSDDVIVEAGATASLVVPMARPQAGAVVSGWISVATPADVQIFEGGRLVGSSRTERIMVAAGRHELELVNEALAYRSSRTVDVAPGQVASVKPDWPKGSMAVNALPWAEVSIDGERVGETPIGRVTVPIGTHDIVFRHPELGERRTTATVTTGAPTRVSMDMRAK